MKDFHPFYFILLFVMTNLALKRNGGNSVGKINNSEKFHEPNSIDLRSHSKYFPN